MFEEHEHMKSLDITKYFFIKKIGRMSLKRCKDFTKSSLNTTVTKKT